jgi:hypothetical protein
MKIVTEAQMREIDRVAVEERTGTSQGHLGR